MNAATDLTFDPLSRIAGTVEEAHAVLEALAPSASEALIRVTKWRWITSLHHYGEVPEMSKIERGAYLALDLLDALSVAGKCPALGRTEAKLYAALRLKLEYRATRDKDRGEW